MAVSSKCEKVLQTACFDQALNLVWYGRLALSNSHFRTKPLLILSATCFGLLAPALMNYRTMTKQSTTVTLSFPSDILSIISFRKKTSILSEFFSTDEIRDIIHVHIVCLRKELIIM